MSVVLTAISIILDWVVKPGCWVSKEIGFVLALSESMWVSRSPQGFSRPSGVATALYADRRG